MKALTPPWSNFVRSASILVLVFSIAISLLGLLVMLGWLTHTLVLIKGLPGLIPMQFNTALCFLFIGAAAISLLVKQFSISRTLLGLVITISLLSLSEALFGIILGIDTFFYTPFVVENVPIPGRMAENTSICFIASSFALILLGIPQRNSIFRLIFVAIFAQISFWIALMAFYEYLSGIQWVLDWTDFAAMALYTSLGILLLNIMILIEATRQFIPPFRDKVPLWLAAVLGVILAIASISFWQILLKSQDIRIKTAVHAYAEGVKVFLGRELNAYAFQLHRIQEQWPLIPADKEQIWKEHLSSYFVNNPGLLAIFQLDRELNLKDAFYNLKEIVPLDEKTLSSKIQSYVAFDLFFTPKTALLYQVDFLLNKKLYLLSCPIIDRDLPQSIFVFLLDPSAFFNSQFINILDPGLKAKLSTDDHVIYSSKLLKTDLLRYSNSSEFKALGNNWKITLWPSETFINARASKLPLFFLLGGFFVSLTSALVFYFAATVRKYSYQETLANHAKSAFLATMSHEIRTPLNGIVGAVSLLENMEMNPRQEHMVDLIKRSGDHLMKVINDVLDISKIEAGELRVREDQVPIRSVLQEVIDLQGIKAKEKGLLLELKVSPSIPDRIWLDAFRFKQVLLNLVGNAVKFTDRGVVEVVAQTIQKGRSSLLEIQVKDSGVGIPKSQQSKLFQTFSQVGSSTHKNRGGTGLGLSISKHLIEMMGGEIRVESEEGTGSTFIFTLPLRINVT